MKGINEEDVRAIVRLLGDIAILDGSPNDKRMSLMAGLCDLIDADAWLWGVASNPTPGERPAWSIFLNSGFSGGEFGSVVEALEHPDMAKIQEPFFEAFREAKPQLTRLRQQIVDNEVFLKTDAAKVWRKAGFGPVILIARNADGGQISSLGIYRRFDRPLFDERQSKIAHIILSEVAWLHENTFPNHPDEGVSSLSPRLRQVLNCLLAGRSRKEIADDLGLSLHTVGDYIKSIYPSFGVRSHPELMLKFFRGDGGDTP